MSELPTETGRLPLLSESSQVSPIY